MLGRHELILGNTFVAEKDSRPPNKEVPPQVRIGFLCPNLSIIM